ncbi:MAG: hypothetical protein JOZ55_00905, partial [Alphaproteobacteria bacterium]|nr:hypothetical protein [Alphaproteobacteria bacterium]
MNKHLSMLFAAAIVLFAAPAYAACPTSSTCDEVTKVLTSPIDTKDAGGTNVPEPIQIDSGGGVTISKASAAVTVN